MTTCSRCALRFTTWQEYHAHMDLWSRGMIPTKVTGRTKAEIVYAVEFWINRDYPNSFMGYGGHDFTDIKSNEWKILNRRYRLNGGNYD